MVTTVLRETHAGPRGIGHGGYVVGLFAGCFDGAIQVTLRRPAPIDAELELLQVDEACELRHGDEVIADAVAATLDLEVPPPPTLEAARAAEADSPSRWDNRGVHPSCFGCALYRDNDVGLAIGVGPLQHGGLDTVAAVWRPRAEYADADGFVDPHIVTAAIDCPGAMAFIAYQQSAGLLGRMVVELLAPVEADVDHVVYAWQIGRDGRKLFAGSALARTDGTVVAASRQTWFSLRAGS